MQSMQDQWSAGCFTALTFMTSFILSCVALMHSMQDQWSSGCLTALTFMTSFILSCVV